MTLVDPDAGAGPAPARGRVHAPGRDACSRERTGTPAAFVPVAVLAVALGVTACGTDGGHSADPHTTTAPAPSSAANPGADAPPPDPVPARVVPACPYLPTDRIEDANGEHVSQVRVSADQPDPACFFSRADGGIVVSVQVYRGTARSANALLDRVAPVATSDKATEPAGWTGGLESFGADKGAVYAVRKEGTGIAVVVKTNQAQTLKAKRIAERTIQDLQL